MVEYGLRVGGNILETLEENTIGLLGFPGQVMKVYIVGFVESMFDAAESVWTIGRDLGEALINGEDPAEAFK